MLRVMFETIFAPYLTEMVVVANVLGGVTAAPQAAKMLRSRSARGVSPVWAAISIVVNAWWIPYALGVGDLSIVPVSVVAVTTYVIVALGVVRFGDAPPASTAGRMIVTATAVAVIPLVVLSLAGWAATGIALGALYGVQLSPAVVGVYRARDISGVSAATWIVALLEALLWGLYGLGTVDAGLITLAVTGSAAAGLVLARLFVRRPRRDRVSRTVAAGFGLTSA
jgi:uncharacterized protein with PQ loop repeat